MRKGGGKAKGASFERVVAKMVIKAACKAGLKVTNRDCYRTPMSGGHVYARKSNPSDLVIRKRLKKRFPFTVECKFYRKIKYLELLNPVYKGQIHKWIAQVEGETPKNSIPLVVMKMNRSRVYCSYPSTLAIGVQRKLAFIHDGRVWYLVLFKTFLRQAFKWSTNEDK